MPAGRTRLTMQVAANGLTLEVDVQGPAGGEPLLLVMGLGMQLVGWPDDLVQLLVRRGFRVIRFDNRDAGLSQGFDALGTPNLLLAGLRHAMHLPVTAPYSLGEMADDAFGLLDALGIARAHVCGASMGGMIAQRMALSHPTRLSSLTLMMTSSGSRSLPQPSGRIRRALVARPASGRTSDVVDHLMRLLHVIGSPGFRPDPVVLRRRIEAAVRRAWRPRGTARQLLAVVADGDRSGLLTRLALPCHVIHGADDPLVPAAAGEQLARLVPGATLDLVDGMGHDLPDALLPRFADGMAAVAARASLRPA